MILTVGNTKGGCGKTTIAFNLAVSQALKGKQVWMIDADRQATLTLAATIRRQSAIVPNIQVDSLTEGSTLRQQVATHKAKFQEVVIDAGGRDSTALRAALLVSDMVLVPFAPRSFDVWALTDMCQLIGEARAVNPNLKAVAVLSMADNAGRDNQDAIDALAGFPLLTYLPTPLCRRKSVASAAGQGLSVLEFKPKDTKAIIEFQCLFNTIYISL